MQTEVYEELARHKRGAESLTRTIHRLLQDQREQGTCAQALKSAEECFQKALSHEEAKIMEQVVREQKSGDGWDVERPE